MIFTANKQNNAFPPYKQPFTLHFSKEITIEISPNTQLPQPQILDWIYCDYQQSTGQVWISLHHPNDDFLAYMSTLIVVDANKEIIGSFRDVSAYHCGLELLYVTLDGSGSSQRLIVHWYDYYKDAAYDIKEMYFNGKQIDTAISVGPLQHTVKVYNIQKIGFSEMKSGDLWTINVVLYDGLTFGFGGRFHDPQQRFNIVGIPNNAQCPYPDTNSDGYNELTDDLHISSMYLSDDSSCDISPFDVIKYYDNEYNQDSNQSALTLSDELSNSSNALSEYTNLEHIITALSVYNGLNPIDTDLNGTNVSTLVHNVWKQALLRRIWYPDLMTIVNVYSNHLSGRFCGITDYTATQFLFAGCQKLPFNASLTTMVSLRAPFDYYTNLVQNNMPYATFGVMEAFADEIILNKAEITLSIGQALAAGLNGFILLKTDLSQKKSNENTWNMAVNLLNSIQYLQNCNFLNVMAPNGAQIVSSSPELAIWSVLRAVDVLIVVGVNVDCDGYDVNECKNGNDPHWECRDNLVESVNMTIPIDWKQNESLSVDVIEIVNGSEKEPDFEYNLVSNQSYLVFDDVMLDSEETTRIFLISHSSR